ncbi:Calx-beta domain-containing protein, partial [Eudoraea adriatica]|uniref:Calx-beta domain-containing protein n=1 Tax=Eudoraea adriatica TaxID=446681 RepID=UPI0003736DD0
ESPLNTGTFTVTLDTPNTSGGNLAISYAVTGSATSGSDYTPLTGTVNIANNASSGTITVTPINDAAVEGPETVIVTLSNDAGYTVGTPNNATVTITSEDVALDEISINNVTLTEGNAGTKAFIFVVSVDGGGNANNNITFTINTVNGSATAGSDYVPISGGSGIITSGNPSTTITVTVNGDIAIEANETFNVNLSVPVNAIITDGTGLGTITNDDSCAAGTSAPAFNGGVTELCDSSGQDLDAYTNTPAPPNSVLTWSTNSDPLNTGAHLSSSVVTGSDSYYGFFYDALNDCASPVLQIDLQFNTTPSAGTTTDTAACNRGNNSVTRVDLDDFITGEDNGSWAWTSGPTEVTPDFFNRVQFDDVDDEDLGVYVYTYTTNTAQGACSEATSTVTISVTACEFDCDVAPPIIIPTVPTTYCDEIDPALSLDDYTDGSEPPGTILVWSRNPNPTDPATDHLNQAEKDNPTVGTYYAFFYATDDLCWSLSSDVTLVVNNTPVITATTSDTLCGSGQALLTVEGVIPPGTTNPNFNWYATETSTDEDEEVLSNSDSYTTPVLTETTSYWVEATANGCTSARQEVIVTVNIEPSPGTPVNGSACSIAANGITTVDLDDLLIGADPGAWAIITDPSGGSVVIDGDNIVDFMGLSVGNYEFTYTTNTAVPPCVDQTVTVTITVTDCINDISIGPGVTLLEGNSGTTVFSFSLSRTGDISVPATVDYTVTGSGENPADAEDFVGGTLPVGTANFIAGSPVGTLNINVNGDLTVEPDETFTVTLSNPSGGATLATATSLGTISNDDGIGTGIDLEITKSVDAQIVEVGQEVIFTVTVNNLANINVSDVLISDVLQSGFEYVSETASLGAYDNTTGEWFIDELQPLASATLDITAIVLDGGVYSNTATLLGSVPQDINDANNEDTVTIIIGAPQAADLLIEKTAESANPLVGEDVVFTIIVTNLSLEGTVSQIVVEDIIPDGPDTEFVYLSHTQDLGVYERATGIWQIPSLAQNQQATLQITVNVPISGIWGNTATIISPPLVAGANPEAFVRVNVNEPTNTEPGFLFNQFSPNGDGTNDLLKINDLEDYPDNYLQIFDRYGNKIYDIQGMTDGNTWDGTRNGEQVPQGTYFYILDLGDGSEIRKGWIQLIR